MDRRLKKSEPFIQAAREMKGRNIIIQIAIFILIFIASQFVSGIVMYIFSMGLSLINNVIAETELLELIAILTLFSTLGATLLGILYCKFIEKRSLFSMGFIKKGILKEYGAGLLIGFIMISIPALIGIATGAFKITSINREMSVGLFLLFFLGYVFQGMSEEVLLRGYLFVSVSVKNSLSIAILTNSILFSALHFKNPGFTGLAAFNLALFGIFASLYFLKRGSIWGVGAIHSIWNFAMGNIYGVEVSGTKSASVLFNSVADPNMALVNGGSFGFEGGLGVTFVLIVAIVLVVLFGDYKKQEYFIKEKEELNI
ncbi:hypothetical protein SAMN02745245_00439 [Anaerosphaera aminiphila DSM 21120]|uniref:CAAX prenyl protease 2/Lysostaphin resistance protein A-like domain-containing protein n=1 Tax=Anaerosphaera aminiphila DSM 21120 TaxID=1120995 RepID=A0A1M5PRG6_9FIRM|nr:type II CAAX endopeptidase family protein [Anaerosphaera aminiphila]SHH04368.1 hypothetical protein SAMN02745245_00439 [Anaerosphaera aminiphila DSM 21120]